MAEERNNIVNFTWGNVVDTPSDSEAKTDKAEEKEADLNEVSDREKDLISENERLKKEMLRLSNPNNLNAMNLTELMDNVYESKLPIIDDMLFCGVYLFVGAPKIGKSFIMLQMAYHVSKGYPLWGLKCRKGTVLYLALEDNYRRLQSRAYRMFGTDENDNLYFSTMAGQVGKALDEQLDNFLADHPDTTLIIIDTLQKVLEAGDGTYSYANDYVLMGKLKTFCDCRGLAMLLVHHTRKQKSDDIYDTISGTNGLLGAADGAFVLTKDSRISDRAVLDVSGRDQQEQRLHLLRSERTLGWELEERETELWKEPREPLLDVIRAFINEENPQWSGSASELVKELMINVKPNVITPELNVLAGRMKRDLNIEYTYKRCHEGRKLSFRLLPRDTE